MMKLRDLVRAVRAAKTASEERAVVAKELALIRTSFKDEDNTFRHRNVAKLLFVHMLGYPTHFGQMECLKLIASPRFMDKRVGYLGLSLLVEDPSVLTLVTNSLSSDLSHRSPYVQALALAALGNIANRDMLRDLSSVVLKLLGSSNPYVRKKAALAAAQILHKVPDMVEDYVPVALSLLADRNHAVQLTACTVLLDIAERHPGFARKVRKAVPALVKMLKGLVLSGYAPEYDVNGIADPFLQVKLLRLLGVLGKEHAGATEHMNDILAQVATNTDTARNAGNSILYECVRTVMAVDCEEGLRVLAVNILGRFLQNRDNNIRYVALHTLGSVVAVDNEAVQLHLDTIVDCLRDADVSIRVRAIDLVFALIQPESVERLVREVLAYLVVALPEQKPELCSRLAEAALAHAPSKRWHADTLVSVLCIAGAHASDEIWQTAVALTGQPESEPFRATLVHRLHAALAEDASQLGLVLAAVWAVGEYAPLLLAPAPKYVDEDAGGAGMGAGMGMEEEYAPVEEAALLDLLEAARTRHDATDVTKGMILSAYVKLSVRLKEDESQQRLRTLVAAYEHSMSVELQARSCEFGRIVKGGFDAGLRGQWLEQMPVPTDDEMAERRVRVAEVMSDEEDYGNDDDDEDEDEDDDDSDDSSEDDEEDEGAKRKKEKKKKQQQAGGKQKKASAAASSNLLDLDDMFGGGEGEVAGAAAPAATATPAAAPMDLLSDIFGGDAAPAPAPAPAPIPAGASTLGSADLLGGFGDDLGLGLGPGPSGGNGSGGAESFPSVKAFNKNGISVTMALARGAGDKQVVVTASYANSNPEPASDFLVQTAVPGHISMKMEPASGTVLQPFGSDQVQQRINLVNSKQGQKPIVMKLRITYTISGQSKVEEATVQGFPNTL